MDRTLEKLIFISVVEVTETNAPRGCAAILKRKMSAKADRNRAPSLTCVRLEIWGPKVQSKDANLSGKGTEYIRTVAIA